MTVCMAGVNNRVEITSMEIFKGRDNALGRDLGGGGIKGPLETDNLKGNLVGSCISRVWEWE